LCCRSTRLFLGLCDAVGIFRDPWEQSPGIYSAPRGRSGILTRVPQPTEVLDWDPVFRGYRMTGSLQHAPTSPIPECHLYFLQACVLLEKTTRDLRCVQDEIINSFNLGKGSWTVLFLRSV
jgi:hypothetical protein